MHFTLKRQSVELEQLRAQNKYIGQQLLQFKADLESLRTKVGGVETGVLPSDNKVSDDQAVHAGVGAEMQGKVP